MKRRKQRGERPHRGSATSGTDGAGREKGDEDLPRATEAARLSAELAETRTRLAEQTAELEATSAELRAQRAELQRAAAARRGVVQELEAERARLAAIIDNAPVSLMIAEAPSGRILLGNPATERILRQPVPRLESVAEYGALEAYHSDGRRVAATEYPMARVLATGESAGPDELHIRRGDGTLGWVRISGAPIRDATGRLRAALIVMDDIDAERRTTEEREALLREVQGQRQRLYETFRQAPMWIAVLRGPNHIYEFVNANYELIVPGRDVIGKPVREAVPELAEQGFVALLDRVYATNEPYLGEEVPFRLRTRPGGPIRERVVTFVYEPTTDEAGQVTGIIAAGVDVTEQVQARRAAEEANRAKSEFLATVSHELRTPLNAMIGYSDLLLQGLPEPLPEADRRSVDRIGISARHLLELIEEILTFSRLEAGREVVELEAADVHRLLEEVTAIAEPLAGQKGLRFHAEPPAAPIVMQTDLRKVRQILLNLVGNAVKFTEKGEIDIATRLEGDTIVFEVRDTGLGIPPEHLEQIFEPFWQVEREPSRRIAGAGLGLSVTRRLARLLGGDVAVVSEPGRGSTFTVRLPLRAPLAAAA